MKRTWHVAVLVDTATAWGRRLIAGVVGYAHQHGHWRLWVEPHGQAERLRLPAGWEGDGVIARVADPATARQLDALGLPVVNVSSVELPGVRFPRVTTDLAAAARLGAAHLLDRGFRSFGYCGLPRLSYVERHCRAFTDAVEARGCPCSVYLRGVGGRAGADWAARRDDLARWLRALPRPAGVLTWGLRGPAVLDACHAAGLRVPEDVAVLGGADDDLICAASTPELSGIAGPSEAIGREAAAALDRMLRGGPPPAQPVLLPPTYVSGRRSTDTLATDDPVLAAALRFIRDHAAEPITVPDVLDAVAVSRRALERRFEAALDRTPADEIRQAHLQRARELLAATDLPLPAVAAASGFGSPEYLATVFKKETGQTPLKYRSRVRGR